MPKPKPAPTEPTETEQPEPEPQLAPEPPPTPLAEGGSADDAPVRMLDLHEFRVAVREDVEDLLGRSARRVVDPSAKPLPAPAQASPGLATPAPAPSARRWPLYVIAAVLVAAAVAGLVLRRVRP
jgi:hypothetical protein